MAKESNPTLGARLGEVLGFDARDTTSFVLSRHKDGRWTVELTQILHEGTDDGLVETLKRYKLVEITDGEG